MPSAPDSACGRTLQVTNKPVQRNTTNNASIVAVQRVKCESWIWWAHVQAVPGRGKRLSQASVVTSLIRIKSHPKRAKVESSPKEGSNQVLPVQKVAGQQMLGLVSYPDESDEEEQIQ